MSTKVAGVGSTAQPSLTGAPAGCARSIADSVVPESQPLTRLRHPILAANRKDLPADKPTRRALQFSYLQIPPLTLPKGGEHVIKLYSVLIALAILAACFSSSNAVADCGPCSSWVLGTPPTWISQGPDPWYCGNLCYGTITEYTYNWVAWTDPNNWSVPGNDQWTPDGFYMMDCTGCGGSIAYAETQDGFYSHPCFTCGIPPNE